MEIFLQGETWIALLTLTFLEIVLGVDNIIFISILSNKLPVQQRGKARTVGLSLALILRILMLFMITWIIGISKPLFTISEFEASGRDIILFLGGMFLLAKSTSEIHHKMEGRHDVQKNKVGTTMLAVIVQVILMDLIFSLDSILTAIGLTEELLIMIIAIVIAMIIMITSAGRISRFISQHPTLEILALSFLILIGFMLILEGFHYHVPKGYIYFAVFYSLIVELLNMRLRKKGAPVHLAKKLSSDT
jgi:predicted tellurium resistance membrane protein TerC